MTGNFLDGEFDSPPSPPAKDACESRVAGESFGPIRDQLLLRIRSPQKPGLSREIHSINIDGEDVRYTLQRSSRRRRTIQLQVDTAVGLKVLVPHTLGVDEIEKFLLKRSNWIRKHHASSVSDDQRVDWGAGGMAKFKGHDLRVLVRERNSNDAGKDLPPTLSKSLEGDTVTVIIPTGLGNDEKSNVVCDSLVEWYRQEAWDYLTTRVHEFGQVLGVQPRQLKLSNAKKRWGSCSGKRSINLNWRLIMLDEALIDYVVVHELAHLIELNHSSAFWSVVAGVLPKHRELRRRLNGFSPNVMD